MIYTDGFFFHSIKRETSAFGTRGLAHFSVTVWPAQSSPALLSLNRWSGSSEQVFCLKQLRVNTEHLHRLQTKHQWVPHYSLPDLKLYYGIYSYAYSILFINNGKCKGHVIKLKVILFTSFSFQHETRPERGDWPLVIFITHSKFISLCNYPKFEWIKCTKAKFALVFRDIYTMNKISWTRCCFGSLAKVSVDIKIRIINKTPLVEKTDVQRKSKKKH